MTENSNHYVGGHSIESVAKYILENDIRKILVMLGAGCSVAAGIPDFRSPNTGVYANLGKYNLAEPSDAFSIHLLRENPLIFYSIAREMNFWPGAFKPTKVHHFVKLLHDQGRLLRCCTQNIDGLEAAAGLPSEYIVEAHGSFNTASCIDCKEPFSITKNKEDADNGVVSRCENCGGIVKPDVVFFGEQLPERFFDVLANDTQEADLLLIIGTSLQVHPFAALPLAVGKSIPRIVFNMERVGGRMFSFPDDPTNSPSEAQIGDEEGMNSSSSSDGFSHHEIVADANGKKRDLIFKQDCQESVHCLAEAMGILDKLITAYEGMGEK